MTDMTSAVVTTAVLALLVGLAIWPLAGAIRSHLQDRRDEAFQAALDRSDLGNVVEEILQENYWPRAEIRKLARDEILKNLQLDAEFHAAVGAIIYHPDADEV